MNRSTLGRIFGRPKGSSSGTPREAHPQGLSVVAEGQDPVIDIVALHGLDGHRERTWTAKNGVHWLRDLLPHDLPRARILCWGYDANTHASDGLSWQFLYDHARTLVSDLCRKRKMTNSVHRPIIFIAHSLGGIVLKSALIHSDAARQGALPEQRSIKLSTYGILFMGTPHQGGNGVQLGRILANVASLAVAADDRLFKHLEKDSEWLQQQLGQYAPLSQDFVTKYAYEEYETPTALGHKILVVPKASAVVPGDADAEPIVIHANHTSIVRYTSKKDVGYITVMEHLQMMQEEAEDTIRQQWELEERVHHARGNASRFKLSLSLSEAPETTNFVAREEELIWMHQELHSSPGRQTVVVHGLGGIGKTQLTVTYMKRHREDFSALIWLNARDETSLKQSFRLAANRICQEHPELTYMRNTISNKDDNAWLAVKRWLDEPDNKGWLLVFDNYDHPKMRNDATAASISDETNLNRSHEITQRPPEAYDICRYLPDTDHGAIIVTSRSSTVHVGKKRRLKKLDKIEDSLRVLESASGRSRPQDDSAALSLAHKLDGLPLALSTAGAYLSQVATTWGEYIQMYNEEWGLLQKMSPQLSTYERALYSTWNISFATVLNHSESAAMLLRLWAYFGNEDLWYELLKEGAEWLAEEVPGWFQHLTANRFNFDHGMRILCSHGLVEAHFTPVEERAESNGYSVHACVHEWTKHVLNKYDDTRLAALAIICVICHMPQPTTGKYWVTQQRLLQHADRCASLLHKDSFPGEHIPTSRLALVYSVQGHFEKAEAMYQRAFRGFCDAGDEKAESALEVLIDLGGLYICQRRIKDAVEIIERVQEELEKKGTNHVSSALMKLEYKLTVLRVSTGILTGNELGVFQKQLNERLTTLGPHHVLTLDVLKEFGRLYFQQRHFRKAEEMFDQVIQGYEKEYGAEHVLTLKAVADLAVAKKHQTGPPQEVEDLLKRVMHGFERALGPANLSTLAAIENLASFYHSQGQQLDKAQDLLQQALEGTRKRLGSESLPSLDVAVKLASLYASRGQQLVEAEAMLKPVLRGYEKVLGENHTFRHKDHIRAVATMAYIHAKTQRPDSAGQLYNQALRLAQGFQWDSSKMQRYLEKQMASLGIPVSPAAKG